MNGKIATIFLEMAALFQMKDVAFKPRAYEHAAHAIADLDTPVETLYKQGGISALLEIPGVGQGIAEKIEEYIKTGHIKEFESLKKKFPVDIPNLLKVEGIGPKTLEKLYKVLQIKTIKDLEKAAKAGKLESIPGLGAKAETKILNSLSYLEKSHGRFRLGELLPVARNIVSRLKKHRGVARVEYAGSLRRMQETIGDLDILVASDDPDAVMEYFVHMPEVAEIVAKGSTKTTVRLYLGTTADIRVVPPESFGAALQYFTGDKYHNIELRKIAIEKGYKLSEYGLFKGERYIAGKTEEELYKKLGMDWMAPELRTNSGEIDAAIHHTLPDIIDYGDLKGDLQTQTDWTDGEHSIREMAQAAKKYGLEYIAITDHTKSLAMTGGADEHKLKQQMAEIDKLQTEISGIKILKGAEVNIMKDGTLDINDETLSQLDVVGASVHSHFDMSEKDMTDRLTKAMENPHVDIIFHPTGRVIDKRRPYNIDVATLIKIAKRTNTILEIDAHPERLDLSDSHIRSAVEHGVILAIDSDAHSMHNFPFLEYGIAQARRGWATKKDVINTRSWKEMLKLLK